MKIGSLFSGYGGLDLGIRLALGDIETVWVSDIEAGPCKILAERFPGVPNLGDVTQVDWTRVEPVDVLCGGFPCQDVSLAGARRGLSEGTRSGLWTEMWKAIRQLRPRMVVIENVPGLLSARADSDMELCPVCMGDGSADYMRALGAVLADLAQIGYDAQWTSVRASDVGAPHRRERVFILAYPAGNPWRLSKRNGGNAAYPGGAGWGLTRDTATGETPRRGTPAVDSRRGGTSASDADRDLFGQYCGESFAEETGPDEGHGSANLGRGSRTVKLLPTPRATDGTKGGPNQRGSSGDFMLPSAVVQLLPTPKARDGDWGDYSTVIARWEQVLGRPAPAPTTPSKTGKPQLSPAFVEWMMGLPDGWVTGVGISRSQQLRALGNGVVPQQAAAALEMLLQRLTRMEATR